MSARIPDKAENKGQDKNYIAISKNASKVKCHTLEYKSSRETVKKCEPHKFIAWLTHLLLVLFVAVTAGLSRIRHLHW